MNREEGLALLRNIKIGDQDPRAWIGRLDAREAAGEKLSVMQRTMRDQAKEKFGPNGEITMAQEDRRRTEALKVESAKQVLEYAKRHGIDL